MKRLFDLSIALFVGILALPLMVLTALFVKLLLGSPVLFVQRRPGLHSKVFKIYKFRTMTNATNSLGELLPDGDRLNWFGKFLRKTSLDELPTLWNVILGQMSLVGPRPLLEEYLPIYSERQALRHDVRPGITGWAQINGRNNIEWEEKLEMDVWYVENHTLILDIKILVRTVGKVIVQDGIKERGYSTSSKFIGK